MKAEPGGPTTPLPLIGSDRHLTRPLHSRCREETTTLPRAIAMVSTRRPTRVLLGVAVMLGTAACHHAPPPEQGAIVRRAESRSFRPTLVTDASAVTLDVP